MAGRFTNRYGGYALAKKLWGCWCGWTATITKESVKPDQCPECMRPEIHTFDSRVEQNRFMQLKILTRATGRDRITNLRVHPVYQIFVMNKQGKPVPGTKIIPDFDYEDVAGRLVVEDVKPRVRPTEKDPKAERALSETFKLKRRLMKAAYGIDIQIVMMEGLNHG